MTLHDPRIVSFKGDEIEVMLTDDDILDGLKTVMGENPAWNLMICPQWFSHGLIGKIKALGLKCRFSYEGEDL